MGSTHYFIQNVIKNNSISTCCAAEWFPCRASWCMLASECHSVQSANVIKTIGHNSVSKLKLVVASHSPAFHLWFFIDTLLQSPPAFIRAGCTPIGYATSRPIQAAKSSKHNNRDGKFATGHADEGMILYDYFNTPSTNPSSEIYRLSWNDPDILLPFLNYNCKQSFWFTVNMFLSTSCNQTVCF